MDYTKRTLRTYIRYASAYPGLIALIILGMVLTIGADITMPFTLRKLFNVLGANNINPIGGLILAIIGLRVISSIGQRIAYFSIVPLENGVMVTLMQESFYYLHRHSSRFFASTFSGSLVKRMNRFAAGFETTADQAFLDFGQQIIRLFCIVCALLWYNRTFGIIAIVWLAIVVYANVKYSKRKMEYDLLRSRRDSEQTGVLADTIGNASAVQLFANLQYEMKNFKNVSEALGNIRIKCWNMNNWFDVIQGVLMIILEAVFYGAAMYYRRKGQLGVGDFVLFQTFVGQIFFQSRDIGRNIRRLYEILADANEMTQVLETPHEIQDVPNAPELVVTAGSIRFADVTFGYAQGERVFTGLNLTIQPGERVALVGPSGGGKTTVSKLLVRQFKLESGKILIDGQDIATVTQDSLRQNIAVVPQDSSLFHRTLMQNIRYGCLTATDEQVITASRLAHCHEFITRQKHGYDSMVGERGVMLSGGQRQRVAIARAILSEAPILILDEATSALDSRSEQAIQDALENLMIGKTVLVIAHRLSTIRQMDRIVVINEFGEIAEEGSHDDLLKTDGHYRELWQLQAGTSSRRLVSA